MYSLLFFHLFQLTVADVHASCMLDVSVVAADDLALWEKYPKLKGLRDRVFANEKIAAWIKKRPETPY